MALNWSMCISMHNCLMVPVLGEENVKRLVEKIS